MKNITLTTINARYIHASLGLRYLKANMGELEPSTCIKEFVTSSRPIDIVEKLLSDSPFIIGFGVYIWNVSEITSIVSILKQISPHTIIVVGGPEISYEIDNQHIAKLADFIITGMADMAFGELCQKIITATAPDNKVIHAVQPRLDDLNSPYKYYSDEDIKNRIIYVEASRGCPFKCEFCLSSLDKTAWEFNIDQFLKNLLSLYDKGLRHFKFVDRTFNLKINTTITILEFFLQRDIEKLFLHFELVPDHLPEKLKLIIQKFPKGSLQFEVGIQTFNTDVQKLISRKQNNLKTIENIRWLKTETTAHLHTDLIVGLPGEDMESFSCGFDQLVALHPDEIQIGILKRLRGTPIIRHTAKFDMRYSPLPPYNILSTDRISFKQMQELNRFSRYWDMIANSGKFSKSLPLLVGHKPFDRFMNFSCWLYQTTNKTHQFSLNRLYGLIFRYMIEVLNLTENEAKSALISDYNRAGHKGLTGFYQSIAKESRGVKYSGNVMSGNKRQIAHQQQ